MTTSIRISSLFGVILTLLSAAGPAWGQAGSSSQSSENRNANQQRIDNSQEGQRSQSADRFSGGRAGNRSQASQPRSSQQRFSDERSSARQDRLSMNRQSADRGRPSSQDRQAAATHFKAGYYAGYRAGYVDAQDDYVLWIIDAQKLRRGQRESGQDQSISSSDRQRLRDEMLRGSGSSARTASRQQFRGEVLRTKQVTLRNTQKTHTLALVESQEGNRRIVDLGPSRQLQDLSIEQGQRISVSGRMARTRDDVPVLLAQRLESGGQTVSIDRTRPEQSSSNQKRSQQQRSAEESPSSSRR